MDQNRNELSLRAADGGVSSTVQLISGDDPAAQSRTELILLIHGYDNTLDAARDSYSAFLDNFQAWLTQNSPNRVNLQNVFKLYWPGDRNWGPVSFGSYPLEIRPAIESAAVLSSYLSTQLGLGGLPIDVFIIAHSLGNRLLLELLKNLASFGAGRIQVRYVCLMAAAVPVAKVKAGGALQSAATSTKTLTLYSTSDGVLEFAFPIGETLAGEGFFPQAVGRYGNPPTTWADPEPMMPYGHHDYWTNIRTPPKMAQMFGIIAPNQISQSAVATRQLPPTPVPLQSATPVRTLPAQPAFG